jgi:hypothetical protein
MNLKTSLLHVPRVENPSNRTWVLLGLGAIGAVGGYWYYRNVMCVAPKPPQGTHYGMVRTTHPDALTADELDEMDYGDKVGVAVGIFVKDHLNPRHAVVVVPGKLSEDDEGDPTIDIDCILRGPPAETVGAILKMDGTVEQSYAQWVGYLFPAGTQGEVDPDYVISY